MRDETAKDNGQTAVGISHNFLDMKHRADPFFYEKSSVFPLDLWKSYFLPQANTSHLIPSVQNPNYWTDLKVSENCENS